MKQIKTISALALLCLGFTFFSGCVTGPGGQSTPDIARIAAVTQEATAFGTREALAQNPKWLPFFQTAHRELLQLETADVLSVSDLLSILTELPIKELKSDTARIAISSARLIIVGAGFSEIDATRLTQLKPIVKALRLGLEEGGVASQPIK